MFYKIQVLICVVTVLLIVLVENRSYNSGLIFYDLKSHIPYLPPTVSVSRGRILANVKYSAKGSIWSTFGKPCECKGLVCGCCAGIKVKQFNFDQKMCANTTFVRAKQEALLEVYLNERPSSKYGISVRDPSPFCIPVMMGVPMAMCVQMSNINVEGNNLNMCMDFVVRLATTDLFEMHFQCMKMGLDGVMYVDKNGQPIIPASNSKNEVSDDNDYYDETEESENEIENEANSKETENVYENKKENSNLNQKEKQKEKENASTNANVNYGYGQLNIVKDEKLIEAEKQKDEEANMHQLQMQMQQLQAQPIITTNPPPAAATVTATATATESEMSTTVETPINDETTDTKYEAQAIINAITIAYTTTTTTSTTPAPTAITTKTTTKATPIAIESVELTDNIYNSLNAVNAATAQAQAQATTTSTATALPTYAAVAVLADSSSNYGNDSNNSAANTDADTDEANDNSKHDYEYDNYETDAADNSNSATATGEGSLDYASSAQLVQNTNSAPQLTANAEYDYSAASGADSLLSAELAQSSYSPSSVAAVAVGEAAAAAATVPPQANLITLYRRRSST